MMAHFRCQYGLSHHPTIVAFSYATLVASVMLDLRIVDPIPSPYQDAVLTGHNSGDGCQRTRPSEVLEKALSDFIVQLVCDPHGTSSVQRQMATSIGELVGVPAAARACVLAHAHHSMSRILFSLVSFML